MTDLNFEDLIREAIIQHFFEPTVAFQYHYVNDPVTGQPGSVLGPVTQPAPVQIVAEGIYSRHADAITEAVLARLDPAVLADTIAQRVTSTIIQKYDDQGSSYYRTKTPEATALNDAVLEKVATVLADRMLAAHDQRDQDA